MSDARTTATQRTNNVLVIHSNITALTLTSVVPGVENPAFSRYHPSKNIFYTATESILQNGTVVTYKACVRISKSCAICSITFQVNPDSGIFEEVDRLDAGGSSTCYLTVDRNERNMLFVNYWVLAVHYFLSTLFHHHCSKDSTLGTFPLDSSGVPEDNLKLIDTKFDPSDAVVKRKKPPMSPASADKKHDANDPDTAAQRQTSAHAHSIVLDPLEGCVAYVPDLGQDCIHQYYFDANTGDLDHRGKIPADKAKLGPHGISIAFTL